MFNLFQRKVGHNNSRSSSCPDSKSSSSSSTIIARSRQPTQSQLLLPQSQQQHHESSSVVTVWYQRVFRYTFFCIIIVWNGHKLFVSTVQTAARQAVDFETRASVLPLSFSPPTATTIIINSNNSNDDSQKNNEQEELSSIHHQYFSACVYVLKSTEDEWMNEWIAYHYFTLRLRDLVVYFDTDDDTDQQEKSNNNNNATVTAEARFTILDRWTRIVADDDDDLIHEKSKTKLYPPHNMILHKWNQSAMGKSVKLRRHHFNQQCAKYLHYEKQQQQKQQRQQHPGWTLFLDVNEFLTLNTAVYNQHQHKFPYNNGVVVVDDSNANAILRQPGGLLRLFLQLTTGQQQLHPKNQQQQQQQEYGDDNAIARQTIRKMNQTVQRSSMDAPAADPKIAEWYLSFQNTTCITIARSLMMQSSHHDKQPEISFFVTLSHQQIANIKERSHPTAKYLSKSVMDVTRLTNNELQQRNAAGTLNRVFKSICPSAFDAYNKLSLGILFYEPQQQKQEKETDDCESSSDVKSEDDNHNEIDSTMQPWIAGFVEWMGEPKATQLLVLQQQHQERQQQNSTTDSVSFLSSVLSNLTAAKQYTTTNYNKIKKCSGANNNKEEEQQHQQNLHDHTSSACLLIKDENHNLIEWLAYHYFTMNLRYLVVAIDDTSVTSPKEILDRWRTNMTIVEWGNQEIAAGSRTILRSITSPLVSENDSPEKSVLRHRRRQNYFYRSCSKHMQENKRTWTTYHDVDEFFTVNPIVYLRRRRQENEQQQQQQNETSEEKLETTTDSETAKLIMRQPGGILDLIYQYRYTNFTITSADNEEKSFWYEHFQQGPCVTIGRDPISAYESTDLEVDQEVPVGFVQKQHSSSNGSRYFNTLRWRYSTCHKGAGKCASTETLSKSLVDVSLLTDEHFNDGRPLVHRVFKVCPMSGHPYNKLPIGIVHYIGSWEVYSLRKDHRRSRDVWEKRSLPNRTGAEEKYLNDHARPWLAGFVDWVGEEEAVRLLKNAGVLSPLPS